MSWFKRHLNWTLIFGWLAGWLVISLASATEEVGFTILGMLLGAVWLLMVSSWYLGQKARNMWNLCWVLFLGWIGFIIFLCLQNKTLKPTNIFPFEDKKED